MPSILRRFSYPLVTPSTMLAMRLRVRPCKARLPRSSSGRLTWIAFAFSSKAIFMLGWADSSSLPLGPSTRTRPSVTCTLTLEGTTTGCFPMRDMVTPLFSPNSTQKLAPESLGPSLAITHHSPAGGQDGDSQAVQDGLELIEPPIEAPAR